MIKCKTRTKTKSCDQWAVETEPQAHVFIDSIIHADMKPLAPFSDANVFLGLVKFDTLHVICLVSAVIGGAGFYLVERFRKRRE